MSNKDVLEKGLEKGLAMIDDVIVQSLRQSCMDLLKEVQYHRSFRGFTGQTQTSYMGGLYVNGKLLAIFNERNWLERPRRSKVPKGRGVWLSVPYEGDSRGVMGKVDIADPSGTSLSTKLLAEYKAPDKGFAIVITTGTEYSELLESVRHLDVLTGTYMEAANIIERNWKKIPD